MVQLMVKTLLRLAIELYLTVAIHGAVTISYRRCMECTVCTITNNSHINMFTCHNHSFIVIHAFQINITLLTMQHVMNKALTFTLAKQLSLLQFTI